ncbi:MAG: PadR family transcriptional regulator [Actinobacteria bacterium]|nr:PadR family transcriptional regulator [Actinomycetota bacterium]
MKANGDRHHGKKDGHAHRWHARVGPGATKGILIPPLFMPSLLLLLKEDPAHGYALLKRMAQLGVVSPDMDPSPVYKTLRWFEEMGLVVSERERGERGPDRKVYRITKKGDESLASFAPMVDKAGEIIAWFRDKYEELE